MSYVLRPAAPPTDARAPASAAIELARTAAGGDVVATRKLLESVAPRMMRVTQAVLGGAHPDVEDVMQQSLIALVQALPSFRGECEPIHYASRIAARIAIATRKRARVARDRRDDAVEIDALSSREGHPQDATNATRRKEAVLQLLSEIPEEQAESMALRFVLGWSLEEISRAMTTPVNTVRSRLRLAKEALRRKIEEEPALAELLEVDA